MCKDQTILILQLSSQLVSRKASNACLISFVQQLTKEIAIEYASYKAK